MPATVRDILLMIRAKEDVTRNMQNVAGSMRRTAAAADAASARARAASLRAQAAQAKLTGATAAQVNALKASAKAWDAQASSISRSSGRLKELGSRAASTAQAMQTTGIVMMAAGAATLVGLKKAVDVAVEWDRQVRLTFTQVDKRFKPSLKELSAIGLRVSRDIAVPFETIQAALFDVFSSTEANMPQAEALLREFAKAAVAGQTDVQTASRATIGLMNSFKVPFKDVNKLLDIQFQLVQEGVGTYEEWANRIGLVSPSAARAGQSVEQMAAALATATRQGMNAARASTSVARAFDAMSNPKTEKALGRIGVKTRDAKGNFRPLVDVLADWRKELEKMPKEDRVKNIIETLKGAGGTIEARRFLQNILLTRGGLELFQDQVKEFATDKGAFTKAYNEMADGVAAKSQVLKNSWQQLKLAIGQALLPAFTDLIDGLQGLLNWFDRLPEPVKNTIAQFMLWGSIIGIVAGAVLLLVGVLVGFAAIIAIAGMAIFPVIAAMVAIGAIVALVTFGIIALGLAFTTAYDKSKPFRDLMKSIGDTFTEVKNMIVNFAMSVWNNFKQYVLPPLKELWHTIETEVLPKAKEFVDWFNEKLKPAAYAAWLFFDAQLKPAFKDLGKTIEEDVIPTVKDLTYWWEQNQYWIKPLVAQLMVLIVVLGFLAGFIAGSTIRNLSLLMSWFMMLIRIVAVFTTLLGRHLVGQFGNVLMMTRLVIEWFKRLWNNTKSSMSGVQTSVTNAMNKVKGVFSNAKTMLLEAGKNLINGLIDGIKAKADAAMQTARNLAASVKNTVTGFFGISSPSKVFKDIGMDLIRGLTEGIKANSTRKALSNALFRLQRDITRSINAADISKAAKRSLLAKWNARLASTTKRLMALEAKRAGLQSKLAAAQKSVNDQIKERNELAEKISENIRKSADITSLTAKETKTAPAMVQGLQKRLAAVKKFQADLKTLAKRGFDKETIAQLAQQGVETAGGMVSMLAGASQSDLNQISKIQEEIRKIGDQTGTGIAGDLYNAGIKAGQGLIKGLQSQIAAITKQMAAIAAVLVKQIKKELGIKSPSKVFADIGVNTARGYINGYVQHMNNNMRRMSQAGMFSPDQRRVAFGSQGQGAFAGTNIYRTFDQKITINTQEIDPRKNSAELGWMLEGRLP